MKKVGKEFRKSLSAILAAAMVVSSMPETSLVANAEEANASYAVDEYAEVGAGESQDAPIVLNAVDSNGDPVSGVSVNATNKQHNPNTDLVFIQGVTLTGAKADLYEVVKVGGVEESTIDDETAYRIENQENAPESLNVEVRRNELVSIAFEPSSDDDANFTYDSNAVLYDIDADTEAAGYTFKITPAANYDLTVTAKDANNEAVAVTRTGEDAGKIVYKIAKSAFAAGDDITISVTAKKTRWSLTLPNVTTSCAGASSATYKINTGDETAIATGATLDNLAKGDKVTVTITTVKPINATNEVTYTVDSEKMTAKETKGDSNYTYTFDITNTWTTNATPKDKVVSDITLKNTALQTVTVEFQDKDGTKRTSGVSAKIAAIDTSGSAEKVGSFSNVDLTNGIQVAAGDYYLQLNNGGKTVDFVGTGNTPENSKLYPTTVDGVTGDVYRITVSDAAVKVTAKDAADEVAITFKNNENIKEVWYSTKTATFDKADYTKVSGNSFKVAKDITNVYIYPIANDTYEVTKSKVGTDAEAAFTDGSVLTVSNVSEATDVTFKATRKEATYTFTANANAIITVNSDTVQKIDGTAITSAQKEADITIAGAQTITVNEGDILEFKVEPEKGYKSAKASLNSSNAQGGTVVEKTGDAYPFQIKANKADAQSKGYVYVEVDGITDNAVATFKAATIDRTSTVSATSQIDKVSVKQPNDSQGKPVDDKDIAYSSVTWQDAGLTEGKSYSFKVTPATGFEVTKVTWNKAGESDKAQTLTASGDYYTISSLPAEDIEIEITTQIKKSEANTITFNFDESKVASVVIDAPVADTTEGAWSIKNGTTVYTTESSISYTVTAKNGYKVTKVNDADETSAAESKSGSKIFTSTDKSATVNITADADAATEKKFIKINNPTYAAANGFSFELADSTVVKKETNYTIYEIAPTVKEAEFTITLDYGKKVTGITYGLASDDAVGNRINSDLKTSSADKKTSTIKGKIVVNQIGSGTSKISPEEYSFTIGDDTKDVMFFGTNEPEVLTNHQFGADVATPIMLGEKVIFKIPEGAKLFSVDKEGKNPKELALDAYGKYTFTVEKDTYFKIDYVVAKADYTVKAATDSSFSSLVEVDTTKDANTFKAQYTVGKVYLDIDRTNLTGHTIKIKNAAVASGFESTAKVVATNNYVEVAVSKKDADKDVKVSLEITDVNADGDVKTATVEATLHLSATLTGIVLKDCEEADCLGTISTGATLDFVPSATYVFPIAEALPSTFVCDNPLTLEDYTTISVKTAEGTAATKATITGTRGNEILTIITPAKDEKATITISNAIEKTEIFTLTANTTAPNYKISKVESPSQSFNSINLTITPDKKIIASPSNMYYEVVVNSTGDTTPAGSLSNKAYYIPVLIDEDGYAAVTPANIKVNTAKVDEAAGTYSFAVRMVLTAAEVNADVTAITPLADSQIVKASAAVTKTFATRNAYYEDKLGLTKKSTTIYNNDDRKVMAVAKYSKNASYFGDVQGYVLNSNEEEVYDFGVTADQTTGEVYVETYGDVQPGKYTLVVQATGTDTGAGEKAIYRASAKMNFTVNQSIRSITETNKKIKYNAKKNTSLTLSPVIEGDDYYVDGKLKYYANKSKAVTYEIEVPARVQGAARANILNNVSIDKKGKITVSKNFVVGSDSADNTFNVRIKANDFENNGVNELISVEVTTENVVPAEVFLGKWNGDAQRYDKLGTTLTVEDLVGARLVAFDATGKDVSHYVTFTSSSSSVKVDKKLGALDKVKPGKNIVFTATTTDGGKKKVKSVKYTIAYTKATNLTLKFDESAEYNTGYNRLVEVSENNYQYAGTVTPKFGFDVIDIIDANNRNKDVPADTSYYNYSLSINGGKIEYGNTKQCGYVYPTAETTTITLKDKTNNKTKKITLKNTNWQTTKAPKTKLVDGKAYFTLWNTLEYSVAGDYEAVYISYSAGSKDNAYIWYGEQALPITDGRFKFEVYGNKVGTEKFTVVFGKYDADGVTFIPQTKAATLSVKVNGIANFKPATKYTYNPYDSKLIELTGTPKDVGVEWSDLANANIGGKPNNFLKYFELETAMDGEGNSYYTGRLKATADLTEKALTDGIDAKDLTGYVSYSYTNAKGHTVTKDTKITVVLENATKAYTASTITMLNTAGSTGTGLVSLNETGMTLAKVQAVDTANWKVDTYTSYDLDGNLAKNIKLTALKAQTAGTTTVDVYVLPANSQYADKTDLKKYGTLVSIPVVIGDAAAFTGKVSVEKLIDLNKTAAFDVATAYSSKKLSGYWTAKAKANDVYKYTIECGKIASATVSGDAATGFAAELKNDGNGDYIQFSVYRSALELGKVYEVPVDVTFADGSAAETVMFDIAVPAKAQSMDDIAADIKKALEETAYDSTKSADMSYVTDAVNTVVIDPISCVNAPTVAWESVEETQADGTKKEVSKKVTVTLTDKRDANTKKEIVVTLPKKVSKKLTKSEIDTALAAYVGRIVQKSEYDALTEDQKKANEYLVTSNDTTRFTIRQYLEKALGENSDYMLSITNFKITKAEDYPTGKAGELSFTYCLVDKYQRYTPVDSGDIAITTLYVAPTVTP